MDKLYTGDIPKNYHYARFGNNYIDLFNTDSFKYQQNYDYYRVYMYDNGFYYTYNTTTLYNQVVQDVEVTDNICYRSDFSSIVVVTFIFALFGVWLINLMTSIVNKGGVLGGLL